MENTGIKWYDAYDDEKPNISYPECYYRTMIEGQTVLVMFQSDQPENSKRIHWNIGLIVYNKRKNIEGLFQTAAITGKIGVKGLFFARRAIQDFEKHLSWSPKYKNTTHYLYATWLDNRRRKVYEYGLKKLGFTYSRYKNKKCLEKIVGGTH